MKAFPAQGYNDGMDLRDYFAARALQAIMSNPTNRDLASETLIAKTAYLYADAMMKTRKETK